MPIQTYNNINTSTTTVNMEYEKSMSYELCNDSSISDSEPTVNPTVSVNESNESVNDITTAKHNLEVCQ